MQQRLVKLRNKVLIQPEIKDANFGYLVAIYGAGKEAKVGRAKTVQRKCSTIWEYLSLALRNVELSPRKDNIGPSGFWPAYERYEHEEFWNQQERPTLAKVEKYVTPF